MCCCCKCAGHIFCAVVFKCAGHTVCAAVVKCLSVLVFSKNIFCCDEYLLIIINRCLQTLLVSVQIIRYFGPIGPELKWMKALLVNLPIVQFYEKPFPVFVFFLS